MTRRESTLGSCPSCGTTIPAGLALVEYERGDGSTGVFAECPDCDDVVRPR